MLGLEEGCTLYFFEIFSQIQKKLSRLPALVQDLQSNAKTFGTPCTCSGSPAERKNFVDTL